VHPSLPTLILLTGCFMPTAYGLRDDGILPPSGATEITAHVYQFAVTTASEPAPWSGFQGRWRLGDRVGLRTNISAAALPGAADTGLVLWNAEGDVLVGLTQEPAQPVTVTLSGGLSALAYFGESSVTALPALQTGFTVSRTLAGTLHPYVGMRVNPLLVGNVTIAWVHTGAGVGWRPRLGDRVWGTFGLEGGWDHGISACAAWSGDQKLGFGDCDQWSVGLYGGVTLEGKRGAARRGAAREGQAEWAAAR
jgi:hypothetical protein